MVKFQPVGIVCVEGTSMSKPGRTSRVTLSRPIEQIEKTTEVTAIHVDSPAESRHLRIQINVGRLLVALGVKALNSPSGRSQEANGAIVVTVVR